MPLRWLYLAVLGPLVLLAALAWWGTQAQLKAAWADARERAERAAPELARTLAEKLDAATLAIPDYPDPPVPGAPSPADAILDGSDPGRLAALRDDPDAGLSPAGLPRRALAAMRIHQLSPDSQDPGELVGLLTRTAPSVLTTRFLESLPDPPGAAAWHEAEATRRTARDLKPGGARWLPSGSFVRRTDSGLLHLPQRSIDAALAVLDSSAGFAPAILHPGSQSPPDLVASTPLPGYPETTRLGLTASATALEAPVRRQQRWTLALLAVAVLTAAGSLVAIHRSVARERRLAEMKTQFVSSVSHELRAPLGSIRIMAESLQQGLVRRPAEFHGLIAREGARLSHLIENVLDFARIEDGRKRYHFEETDLTALIHDTLELMTPLAGDRGVHLKTELTELTATVDPGAIQQALVNLLDNALKFSPADGTVTLATDAIDGAVRIRITDEGPGIPEKDRDTIFERFHRLGNELRRETQGAGIGLSIVRHISAAHHGTITVENASPKGSTFTLTLPLITDHFSIPCAS